MPRGGDEMWPEDALLHQTAELTINYSGAELANLLNEAAILMVRLVHPLICLAQPPAEDPLYRVSMWT